MTARGGAGRETRMGWVLRLVETGLAAPDGHHIAVASFTHTANMRMLEGF